MGLEISIHSVPSIVSDHYDPMDFNQQVSSVHGILQARILEWVAMPFSRESSLYRNINISANKKGIVE